MDSSAAIALASFALAVLALMAVLVQVNLQISVEQRRKGKTDKLALGDWAITWPQAKFILYLVLKPFGITTRWGDPRLLMVPFITVAAVEKYLRLEAKATGRHPLARRMQTRLVEAASATIATGGGGYTGRMYQVRATTRKRSEACWSDAMDMCGMTRQYWPLLTGVSAQACDGAVRPANAVTNLHSLWGFARAMGLGDCKREGSKVTFSNWGGASIYLDQYVGPDRPTRLAHFSGSPNGRYKILEEMSQHTGPSIYADAVWSSGCIPATARLEVGESLADIEATPTGGKKPKIAVQKIKWPGVVELQSVARDPESKSPMHLEQWSMGLLNALRIERSDSSSQHSTDPDRIEQSDSSSQSYTDPDIVQFVGGRTAAVTSCIRTFPLSTLAFEKRRMCDKALLWCVDHWWLSPYESRTNQYRSNANTPRLPTLGILYVSCEFVTDPKQGTLWCKIVRNKDCVEIKEQCWKYCRMYALAKADGRTDGPSEVSLGFTERSALLKVLQCWKLFLIEEEHESEPLYSSSVCTALLVLLTMALVAIANNSSSIGDEEYSKATEIELG